MSKNNDVMTFVGKGRSALELIVDPGSFEENKAGNQKLPADLGPGAVVGTAALNECTLTVITIDAKQKNPRFGAALAGVIGLEEAYKMATAVYYTIEADATKQQQNKRPILLIVDTPGNAPGKVEEIFGMHLSTGAYQLALADARQKGHPILALIVGRAISGAFLCHGLQADRILSLSAKYGTKIHVMPLSSISAITKIDIERLEELAASNPVFASGAEYFYKLGGLEEIIENSDDMRAFVLRHMVEIGELKQNGSSDKLGPQGRGLLGAERGGRRFRGEVINAIKKQFSLYEKDFFNEST